MNEQLLDRLVVQVYQAAAGRIAWEQPLATICDAVDAFHCQLLAVRKRCGSLQFSHAAGRAAPEAHQAYLQRYHRLDPRVPLLLRHEARRWLHCHQRISEAQVAADPFYQEHLIPHGGRWASGIKLFEDDELAILLDVQRGRHQTPLPAAAVAWLDRLREHFSEALLSHRHLLRLQRQAAAGRLLIDAMPQAMLLVDGRGRLRHHNPAAQRLFDETTSLLQRGGQIGCRHPDDEALLRELLDPLLRGDADARRQLRVRRVGGGAPLGLSLSRLMPAQAMGSFGAEPLALLVVHDSGRTALPDRALVAEVFQLSPAETEVAMLLCEGLDAEAIAERRAVSLGTVRTQLRGLLTKSGCKRQIDLLRQLLALERCVNG